MAHRPLIYANRHAVAAGHPLAAQAAYQILEAGGNAIDAGVAAGITLGVTHSDMVSFAGVAPIMIRLASSGEVITLDGLGGWPQAASYDYFVREHGGVIPPGMPRTVVPAAPSAWITALMQFGTMTFGEVALGALNAARDGFGVNPLFAEMIEQGEAGYRRTEAGTAIYLPNDRPPRTGERFVQADLANSLQYMIDEERAAASQGRVTGLQAAHDAFYRGDIATRICAHYREHGGLLAPSDLNDFRAKFEAPLRVAFSGLDIFTCGAWCQGISLAQAFVMLEASDVKSMAHNSAEYIHLLTETFKLVFADRERYVGDPNFVDVPVERMLDTEYARTRLAMINPGTAWPEMPPAGAFDESSNSPRTPIPTAEESLATHLDTSYAAVIDSEGNMFSATPSDSSSNAEIVPGLGFAVSSRGSQSRVDPMHPSSVEPGKRPRLTPNPALALKDGRPYMVFGTPGADVQPQAMVQAFLNIELFGMSPQDAVEAPRFASYSFPGSFAPHDYFPGRLCIEDRVSLSTRERLSKMGHEVVEWPSWIWKAGAVSAIVVNEETGLKYAAADPRREGYALGR